MNICVDLCLACDYGYLKSVYTLQTVVQLVVQPAVRQNSTHLFVI